MAYVAMSRQSYVAMPLSEAQLATMSPSQVSLELSVLESLKTKLLKKQEAIEKRDLETQAAMKEEDEEHTRTLKRQPKRLKEALASKRLKEAHKDRDRRPEALASLERTYSFEDLETLASLKRTYEKPDEKQRLKCEVQHGLLVDEIAAKRSSKPGESDSAKLTWSPGAGAIASHYRGLAIESLAAKARLHQKYQGSLPCH